MNGPIIDDSQGGTPISALKQHLSNIGYVADPRHTQYIQQMQHMQRMKQQQMQQHQLQMQQHQIQQMQQHQLQQTQNMEQKISSKQEKKEKKKKRKAKNLQTLVSDINKSLENFTTFDKTKELLSTDEEYIDDTNSFLLKEPIIICILFVIFSQQSVRGLIGNNIKQMKINSDGTISLVALTIYGLIIGLLFVIIKKLL